MFNLPDFIQRLKYYPVIIPPRRLRRSKLIRDFLEDGQIQLQRLVKYANLNSKSNILDIGCGGGKLISALLPVIKEGTYSTFEVNNEYIFPYYNNVFDIVYLNSIFTHLLPSEISHYLSEIKRVLKPGAIVLATYFIVNNESLLLDNQGLSSKTLVKQGRKLLNYRYDNYWARDTDANERLIGVDEEWLKKIYGQNNYEITNIVYGSWCGREENADKTLQDIVVSRKTINKLFNNSFENQ